MSTRRTTGERDAPPQKEGNMHANHDQGVHDQ
jgi:hypothetical protein